MVLGIVLEGWIPMSFGQSVAATYAVLATFFVVLAFLGGIPATGILGLLVASSLFILSPLVRLDRR